MYGPLAAELYNIAFVSCWKHMHDQEKQKIMNAFKRAIEMKHITKKT